MGKEIEFYGQKFSSAFTLPSLPVLNARPVLFCLNPMRPPHKGSLHLEIDGYLSMTGDFTPFLTVSQSYQDDEWVKIEGCVQ